LKGTLRRLAKEVSKRFHSAVVVYLKPAQLVVEGNHEWGGLIMSTRNESAYQAGVGAGFRIECQGFKAFEKNTLRGFVIIKITPPGLIVNDVCLHEKNSRRWLSLPAKPYQDKAGTQQWMPVVAFEDKEILRRFQIAGLAAIDCYLQQGGGQ
jgi:hypothetical protein